MVATEDAVLRGAEEKEHADKSDFFCYTVGGCYSGICPALKLLFFLPISAHDFTEAS